MEEYSEGCSSDGEQFAPSNLTNTPAMFLSHGKTTDVSRLSRFGMMCEVLTESLGVVLLMSFRAAFRAQISAQQAAQIDVALMEKKVDYGEKCNGSFLKYDLDSRSWKTLQHSLFGGLEEFSETWPRWGIMQNGECSAPPMLGHDTSVREYGSLPIFGTPIKTQRSRSEDFMGPAKNPFELCPKGFLPSPKWCENLMGWPEYWTSLKESETVNVRKWYERHGTSCAKKLGRKKNNMVVCKTSYNSAMPKQAQYTIDL